MKVRIPGCVIDRAKIDANANLVKAKLRRLISVANSMIREIYLIEKKGFVSAGKLTLISCRL